MNNLIKNIILTPFNLLYHINPKLDLQILFRLKQGYKLNLKEPKTYNEKIQWIKLNYYNEKMPECCDKYTVRDFVKKCGCPEILNELLWEGYDPEKIPFDDLPEQFVIKVTHGSGYNIICTDKSNLERRKAIDSCKRWQKKKFIPCYGEWFYNVIRPRVIVEKYLITMDLEELIDYKVFCFNGKAKYIDVHTGRYHGHKRNIYNLDWTPRKDVQMKYPHGKWISEPAFLKEMIQYAEMLSKKFLHARIDFYITDNKIVFGEITFTNGAGFDKISPYSFDLEMGGCLW